MAIGGGMGICWAPAADTGAKSLRLAEPMPPPPEDPGRCGLRLRCVAVGVPGSAPRKLPWRAKESALALAAAVCGIDGIIGSGETAP